MSKPEQRLDAVLIVDDEPVNRLVLRAMVEGHFHRVLEASSGAEALELLQTVPLVLLLLDIHMPMMSGIEVVAELRRDPGCNPDLHVIAVTGDTTRSASEYGALGFDGFIIKPISLHTVQEALARARTSRPSPS